MGLTHSTFRYVVTPSFALSASLTYCGLCRKTRLTTAAASPMRSIETDSPTAENVAFPGLARSLVEGHRCVPGSSQAYGATLTTPGVALLFTPPRLVNRTPGRQAGIMPRSSVTFVCAQCGGETLRWAGQCPYCQAWNTLQELQVKKEPGRRARELRTSAASGQSAVRPVPVTQISAEGAPRLRLAWSEFNRVLGGGLVPRSLVLVGG